MSFILDALKRSENERQRHQGPSLIDVPQRRMPAERPWWVFVLAGLLVLNLVVFVVVMLRRDEPQAVTTPTPAPVAPPVTAPPAPAPTAVAPPPTAQPPLESGDPTVRSLAEEAGIVPTDEGGTPIEPDLADAGNVPEGPSIVAPIRGPSAAPVRTAPPAAATPAEENLPTINDITTSGKAQLPAVHLDIHVYATAPANRFVFINMKKYREGESTAEGLLVEQIRRDDVVLNHQGTRFVLPRQ